MTATLAAPATTLLVPFVLTDDLPADLDSDGNVVCRDCGTTLHTTRALLAVWVDVDAATHDTYRVLDTHLCG
ncbi:hypothetical protein [Nocardiopsis sp. FR26]|uniref:hypothetical protein n=1 Tax=Nocardiopsis sp. FR26 TaxID=2605987 RepID=UPI00135B75B1|nr:hypothetical protein [Nocardiopsis sp. FR26]